MRTPGSEENDNPDHPRLTIRRQCELVSISHGLVNAVPHPSRPRAAILESHHAAGQESIIHRGHGHALAKGAHPGRVMAELFGKADGICGGRGGTMHLYDKCQVEKRPKAAKLFVTAPGREIAAKDAIAVAQEDTGSGPFAVGRRYSEIRVEVIF